MALSGLFVARIAPSTVKPPFGQTAPTGETGNEGEGGGSVAVFLTPKSLTTFPTASLAVTVLCTLSRNLYPALVTNRWVPIIAAMLVGAIIFLISISDSEVKPKSKIDWLVGGSVAFINALYLAAVASKLL
jgi:hypothetical protein